MSRRTTILFRGEPAPAPVSTLRALDRLEPDDYDRLAYLWFQNVWFNEHEAPTDAFALERYTSAGLNKEFRRHVRDHGSQRLYRGGTVEEIWLARQVKTRVPLMALLNAAQPECRVDRITRRRRWADDTIVTYLESVLELTGCRALVFDKHNGYTIFPRGFDSATGGLIYTDPWPGESVLCAGRNRAGTRAIRHTRGNWLLSRNDFTNVLFAAFIPAWAFEELGDVVAWFEEMEARRDKRRSAIEPSRRKRSPAG